MDIAIKIALFLLKALWATAKFAYVASCLVLGYGLLLFGAIAAGYAQRGNEDDEPVYVPDRESAGVGPNGPGMYGQGFGTGLMESDRLF